MNHQTDASNSLSPIQMTTGFDPLKGERVLCRHPSSVITSNTSRSIVCSPPALLEVTTARSRADYRSSFRILHDSYVAAGLAHAQASGMRIMPFHLLPQTQLFVGTALASGTAQPIRVATLSLVIEAVDRLPMDVFFATELEPLRHRHELIAELTSFAVSTDYSRPLTEHLVSMTAAAIQFARRQQVAAVVAAVHPRHVRIYERIMGFKVIGPVASHGGVLGNPAIPIAAMVNDSSAVHPRYLDWYFGDRFTADQLRRTHMRPADRKHFAALPASHSDNRPSGPLDETPKQTPFHTDDHPIAARPATPKPR